MRRAFYVIPLVALTTLTTATQGQGVGVVGHVGTLGVGADLAFSVAPQIGVRGGINVFPGTIDFTVSDIDFKLSPPSPQFLGVFDFFPGGGGFHLSGGLLLKSRDLEMEGTFTGTVQIGPTTYDGPQLGTLTGTLDTKELAPYVGIGLGNPAGSRIGFFLDLGVAFQGKPAVSLSADGPIASVAQFQSDLEAERQQMEDDVQVLQYYPVVSLGLSIGFSSPTP